MAEKFSIDRKTFDMFSDARKQEILAGMSHDEAVNLGLVDALLPPSPEVVRHRVERAAKTTPPATQESALVKTFIQAGRATAWCAGYFCYGSAVCCDVTADILRHLSRWLLSLAHNKPLS